MATAHNGARGRRGPEVGIRCFPESGITGLSTVLDKGDVVLPCIFPRSPNQPLMPNALNRVARTVKAIHPMRPDQMKTAFLHARCGAGIPVDSDEACVAGVQIAGQIRHRIFDIQGRNGLFENMIIPPRGLWLRLSTGLNGKAKKQGDELAGPGSESTHSHFLRSLIQANRGSATATEHRSTHYLGFPQPSRAPFTRTACRQSSRPR